MENGIETVSCQAEDAPSQFKKQGSDRGVVCLSNDQGLGHAIAVSMENGLLTVNEGGQKIPLDQYQVTRGYNNAEFIIPENVNTSTLQDIQHRINLNRIVRATYLIGYVGQGDGMKYGNVQFTVSSTDPTEIGEFTGHGSTRSRFNLVEGNSLTDGSPAAHALGRHVGKTPGKTCFINRQMQNKKCSEAEEIVKTSKKDPNGPKALIEPWSVKQTNEKGHLESVIVGEKKTIVVPVKKFEAWDVNGTSCKLKHVLIVYYKTKKGHIFLPQTAYPCEKSEYQEHMAKVAQQQSSVGNTNITKKSNNTSSHSGQKGGNESKK
jgi:hypothetical protein